MSEQWEPSARIHDALEMLDLAVKGARAYRRDDLVERLTGARQLLTEPAVTVYVVGEFKQGKSSLINALLAASVCPVDDDIATAVPTEVRYAEKTAATAYYEREGDDWGTGRTESISLADLTAYVSEHGNPGNHRKLRSVAVGIDRQLLAGGLVLVDTPGVGGLGSVHNSLAVGALPQAHAVIFVSDASQELTSSELKFLWTAEELCPTILFAVTKTDLYPQWRRILELDMAHLRNSGFRPVEPMAVSSALRTQAGRVADHELNAESGFPALVSAVQRVVRDAEHVALRSVAHHVLAAVGQLETTLKSRKVALDHPERSEQLLADLTRARERADRLRSKSARWQSVLLDGMADATSDVDFDLRSRARMVMADADKAIDDGDPANNWDEFEGWLRQRLAAETLENYALLVRGAKDVAQRVAEHFELAESAITPTEVKAPVTLVETIEADSSFIAGSKRPKGLMAGLRGSFMGFGMFSILGSVLSFSVAPPVGLVAAAIFGGASFREDRARQLEKRRSQAKAAIRRVIDDFTMQVGKGARDDLRRLQREMRGGYTQLAEELQRSMSEALSAAQQAVHADETDHKEVNRVEADLRLLDTLRTRAGKVGAPPGAALQESVVRSGIAG